MLAGAYVLTWASVNTTFCEGSPWPSTTSEELAPSGFVTTPAITVTTSYGLTCSGAGGNATASVTITVNPTTPPGNPPPTCTPPQVLINDVCSNPPAVSLTLSLSPVSVADDSQGCPPPNPAQSCVASVNTQVTSSLAGDGVLCYAPPGQTYTDGWLPGSYGLGPYPPQQDGPVVVVIDCMDTYEVVATASITLEVVPPLANPVGDTFTGVTNAGVFTGTWSTTSAQGAGGCSIQIANDQGVTQILTPGGTPSGGASSGFLPSSGDPWTATLICSGSPDVGVPSITINP